MQLTSLASDVKVSGVGQTSAFTMEANEFSFRVLSDGLYQNKIGSMVREVSCNALDSHVQAGKGDVPIRLHLPDTFEPYFSVQDMGIGLDDVGIRQTFATYFRSTKRENNTAIGAFGLGSKTPFAYTDAFTIVAIKDGRKRQYSAFIDENGRPCIANMGGEFTASYTDENGAEMIDQWDNTDEGNGVTIIVPVTSSGDFVRFRNEVQNQLAFFTVKPEILNYDGIRWMDWSSAASYLNIDNVLVGERSYNSNFSGLWILQGVVGYRADVNLINQHISPENREFLQIIGDCAILRFELGEIEVTPSREGVSYGKKTIAAIERLLDNARVVAKAKVQEQVDSFGDAWATATGINRNNMLRRMASVTGAKFEAEGYYKSGSYYYLDLEKIANIEGLENEDEDDTVTLTTSVTVDDNEEPDNEPSKFSELLNLQFRQYTRETVYRSRRIRKWREGNIGRHAKADETFTVLVRDTADKPVVRIREFMAGLGNASLQVYVLQNRGGGPVTPDEFKQIKARIGDSWKPVMLSDVPLPEKVAYGRPGYKCPTGYTYGIRDDVNDTSDWEREYEKLSEFDGAYYVTVYRNQTNTCGVDRIVFDMFNAGLLDKPIMAIREKDAAKLADNPEWIPVSVKAKEIVAGITNNKAIQNARIAHACHSVDVPGLDSTVVNVLRNAWEAGKIHDASPLHRLFRLSRSLDKVKARASRTGYNSIVEAALRYSGDYLDADAAQSAIRAKAEKLVGPVVDTYPLLPFLMANYYRRRGDLEENGDAIVAYVNQTHAGA